MAPPALPPRVLLVMPEQWPRALLRAALRELGYDAIGTRTLRVALHLAAPDPARGPVRLVVLDQEALAEDEEGLLEELRGRTSGAPMMLLAPVTRRLKEGDWTRVIRRPASVATLVQVIETLVPLAPEARHSID